MAKATNKILICLSFIFFCMYWRVSCPNLHKHDWSHPDFSNTNGGNPAHMFGQPHTSKLHRSTIGSRTVFLQTGSKLGLLPYSYCCFVMCSLSVWRHRLRTQFSCLASVLSRKPLIHVEQNKHNLTFVSRFCIQEKVRNKHNSKLTFL